MNKKWKYFLTGLLVLLCGGIGVFQMRNSYAEEPSYMEEDALEIEETKALTEPEDDRQITQEISAALLPTPSENMVHVCGAVQNPGVYPMPEGSRVYEAVEAAGGFLEDADENYRNQAEKLQDGMKLYIPTKDEVQNGVVITGEQEETNGSGLVNINTASEEVLCTLPGIGTSKAKSIIAYREEHGKYGRTEDLMNVPGIKDGLFQKVKDSITV